MLALRNITVRFGALTALDDVSVSFERGSIHAILGENGAGKSTLMRVLYGLVQPQRGWIELDGRALRLRRPADAQGEGIGMVHQHFMLVERMSVAENLALAARDTPFWISRRSLARRAGVEPAPNQLVTSLAVGQRQRVELAKALAGKASTLILDEPTAVLTPGEIEQLFETLRRARDGGSRVLYITHKLREVGALCDHVTVLRRGRVVCSEPVGKLTPGDLAKRMVGQVTAAPTRTGTATRGEMVLRFEHISTASAAGGLRDVSFELRGGEICGVVGVEGNGQADLTRVALGMVQPSAGRIECVTSNVAHIADDRQREALVLSMSVADNAVLKRHAAPPFSTGGRLNRGAIRRWTSKLVTQYDVRTPSIAAPVAALSGGNQQKLVVGRELAGDPAFIVAVNPTRGLDVAATAFVQQQLLAQRARGAAVLLVSADLDEALALADRIFVLFGGQLFEAAGPPFDVGAIGRQMAGWTPRGNVA